MSALYHLPTTVARRVFAMKDNVVPTGNVCLWQIRQAKGTREDLSERRRLYLLPHDGVPCPSSSCPSSTQMLSEMHHLPSMPLGTATLESSLMKSHVATRVPCLSQVDSSERPTAKQALDHPFLLRELCVDTVHNMLSSV